MTGNGLTSLRKRARFKNAGTWLFGTLVAIALSRTALAQDATSNATATREASKFLRLTTAADGSPQTLDVAITKFRSPQTGGVSVDLIGAVHIGERHYYEQLNNLFEEYDVLLYELVAPENTVIPRGGKREGSNPVAMLQDSAKSMLGLESQLELVDYTKANFVRADMTPQQISDKMTERGETPFTVALSTLADMMRQQNLAARQETKPSEVDLSLFDMFGNPLKMKRAFAQQFAATGSLDQALGGALNQMLVIDRNEEALKGLQKQMAAGKKKIGIFYGAAHMPDFEKRLMADFGLERTTQTWLVAWDLQNGPATTRSEPKDLLFNLLRALGE
jgi:hypothetical protein